ncbi:hypothetical protein [Paenibacillus mangrovi]|nr:hypothetical protein [Paenibacillus mangrovi]
MANTYKKTKGNKYAHQTEFAEEVLSKNERNLAVPQSPRRFGNK